MEEIVLLIYVKDVEYGKRFLRFLAGKKFANLYLELITKKSGINGHRGDNIVVLTDDLEVKEDEKQKVIYLCKEQSRQEKKIYQYQKAEMICRELTEILHLKKRERKEEQREDGSEKNGVYCVFSTEGVGSTLLSVMLSQYLGNYGNCLYISLAGFPLFYEGELKTEPDFEKRGVGELLFLADSETFRECELQIRQPFGKGYMLGPMTHFKDLLDCKKEDWISTLQRLKNECGYDSVVVELGQIFENTLEFLEQGDHIFVIQGQGICGRIKKAVFQRYCQMENKEQMERKIHYVELSWEMEEWEKNFSEEKVERWMEDNQKKNFVEKLLECVGGESDICIIEDFT